MHLPIYSNEGFWIFGNTQRIAVCLFMDETNPSIQVIIVLGRNEYGSFVWIRIVGERTYGNETYGDVLY